MRELILAAGALLLLAACPAPGQQRSPFREGTPAYQILEGERGEIARRFAGYAVTPEVQSVSRGRHGSAHLVYLPVAGPPPLLFGSDDAGRVTWRNHEPLKDVRVDHYHPRVAASPEGAVLLVYSGTDPWGVHARLFDRNGQPLWTTRVTETETDHLNVIHWPGHGWVIAYSRLARTDPKPGVGVQLLGSDGKKQWGSRGRTLQIGQLGHSPVSLIRDRPESILALWYQRGEGPHSPSVFVGQRISPRGAYLWRSPTRLGEAPRFGLARPREIALSPAPTGGVYADLYRGEVSDIEYSVTEYRVRISRDARVDVVFERKVGIEDRLRPMPAPER